LIISKKKPFEEILEDLEGDEKIVILGCGECATATRTGGEPEVADMRAALEAEGKQVVFTEVVHTGCHELDVKRMTAKWRGATVPLTLTEFWMVHALARHPGHVKDRDALMRDANIVVDDATITSHVKRIRRKFEALDPAFDRIATVYGMGYRWLAEGGS